ncbi:MAG: helix-turn-helix transcriptional regulator [Fibrobacter sp.]|nr:helix-turn-helix transcriptional regulator [Fibrobacter sp.]
MIKTEIHTAGFIFFSFIFLSLSFAQTQNGIEFYTPKQGAVITSSSCTLHVETQLKNIKKVEFQVRYFDTENDTAIIKSISTISRPPYKLVWDISSIPNQLFTGAAFLAEATLNDGTTIATKLEGVFLTHQPVNTTSKLFPYQFSGLKVIKDDTISFPSPRAAMSITGSSYWNEKEIVFLFEVKDPLFYVNISRELLANLGVEILIDPNLTRTPFPNKDILIYSVPLYGNPYRIIYRPSFDDSGSFDLPSKVLPCDFPVSVTKEDFKGFKIAVPIPAKEFGGTVPKQINCNFIVKTLNEGGQISQTSWIRGNLFEAYSPFLWIPLKFEPKPVYKNRLLMWGLFFITGLLLTILTYFLIQNLKKPHKLNKFERSEAEQEQFDRIKEALERRVTQKSLPIEKLSQEMKISPKSLNKLIKKFTGMSLHNYIMYCRIEIAIERLRSSHCSEASIADACGFANANELEKYFRKFHKTTPYKYRVEQQVS